MTREEFYAMAKLSRLVSEMRYQSIEMYQKTVRELLIQRPSKEERISHDATYAQAAAESIAQCADQLEEALRRVGWPDVEVEEGKPSTQRT